MKRFAARFWRDASVVMSCRVGSNKSLLQAKSRAGVAACHDVSGYVAQKSLASRFSVAGDAVFRGVLRVSRAHVPSFLP